MTSQFTQMGILTDKPLQLAAWLLLTACRNLPMPYPTVPLPTAYGHVFFSQNMDPYPQNLHDGLWPNCISGMVNINRLSPFTNSLSNASFPTLVFSAKQGYWPLAQILGLQIAAKLLQIVTWSLMTAYRNLTTSCPTVQLLTAYGYLFSQNRGFDHQKQYVLSDSTVGYPSDRWACCCYLLTLSFVVLSLQAVAVCCQVT